MGTLEGRFFKKALQNRGSVHNAKNVTAGMQIFFGGQPFFLELENVLLTLAVLAENHI